MVYFVLFNSKGNWALGLSLLRKLRTWLCLKANEFSIQSIRIYLVLLYTFQLQWSLVALLFISRYAIVLQTIEKNIFNDESLLWLLPPYQSAWALLLHQILSISWGESLALTLYKTFKIKKSNLTSNPMYQCREWIILCSWYCCIIHVNLMPGVGLSNAYKGSFRACIDRWITLMQNAKPL